MTGPTLRTERLVMRPPQAEDAAAITAFWGSDRSRYLDGPEAEDLLTVFDRKQPSDLAVPV